MFATTMLPLLRTFRRAAVAAMLVALLVAVTLSASPPETQLLSASTTSVGSGELEVRSSPAVATQIRVGDVARNTSKITGLPLAAGSHLVCFSAPEGYLAPPCQEVTVEADQTHRVTGEFLSAGRLVVEPEPAGLPATVIVDGVPRDDGSISIPIGIGTHEVCFEEVTGYVTPDCQDVEVVASEETLVRGTYTPAESAEPEPTGPEPTDPVEGDDPSDDGTPSVVETTEVYSWALGGKTMTREHVRSVEAGPLGIRLDFTRAEEVEVALLDATGTQITSVRGGSGLQFTSEVPAGTYHVTVTGSRAHYDLTITSNQLR